MSFLAAAGAADLAGALATGAAGFLAATVFLAPDDYTGKEKKKERGLMADENKRDGRKK